MKQQVQSARSLARSISGMALGAPTKTTSQQAKPPEKGVFPLDHFDECKEEKATCVRQRALSQPFAATFRLTPIVPIVLVVVSKVHALCQRVFGSGRDRRVRAM